MPCSLNVEQVHLDEVGTRQSDDKAKSPGTQNVICLGVWLLMPSLPCQRQHLSVEGPELEAFVRMAAVKCCLAVQLVSPRRWL